MACAGEKTSKPVTVFCAASLAGVISEIADSFKTAYDTEILLNFASSGSLARQIELGAGADIYLSANKKWVQYLVDKELVPDSVVKVLLSNKLVIIGSGSAQTELQQIFQQRVAFGDPVLVPAGQYAQQYLQKTGQWPLNDKALYANDVKGVLRLVELGEADAGIVYLTDAVSSQKAKVLYHIPDSLHEPVLYYKCHLNSEPHVAQLNEYLSGSTARRLFKKHAFNMPQ